MSFNKFKLSIGETRGFSVLEVLITALIIGIITAIVLVRYGAFNSTVLLNSQAYELAIDLRETQVFSISVLGRSSQFREEYGLYFDLNNPQEYQLFLDNNANDDVVPAYYNDGSVSGQTDEAVDVPYLIDSRFEIISLCIEYCTIGVDNLSVSFKRPDFDAQFYSAGFGEAGSAQIIIASVEDPTAVRAVSISPTGQFDILRADEVTNIPTP
jgi:prepilin-type N-terminal cleavage/methylation domain-containing protein